MAAVRATASSTLSRRLLTALSPVPRATVSRVAAWPAERLSTAKLRRRIFAPASLADPTPTASPAASARSAPADPDTKAILTPDADVPNVSVCHFCTFNFN